ncbi:MAG: hypothetical protein OXC57_09030 [Rhodobacteraceae bacterium]|nr:hypothetical protein [Paracoccaceae bacterium]
MFEIASPWDKKSWSGSQARVGSEVPVMMCYGGRNLKRQAPVIEVVVLDPANLQVELRSKKVKTDRLDAERMGYPASIKMID